MSKIVLQGYIVVPDSDLAVVERELSIHEQLTRQEPGCLLFEVIQDQNNCHRFNVYEEFIDQQAFDDHQKRVKNSNWGKITANVQRHYRITK